MRSEVANRLQKLIESIAEVRNGCAWSMRSNRKRDVDRWLSLAQRSLKAEIADTGSASPRAEAADLTSGESSVTVEDADPRASATR